MVSERWSYKLFNTMNTMFFGFLSVIMLFPFINVLTLSLEPEYIASETGVIHLFPKEFTLHAYQYIFREDKIINALSNSIFVTIVGSFLGVLITAMLAYGLSDSSLKGNKFLSYMVLFTMMFSGGIIPLYLLVKKLGMLDSQWSLIVPTVITAYNTILMRSFFKSLPDSLKESAMLDGCNEVGVFFRIVLPLSAPIIATIVLFYAVAKWNDFFSALIYITSSKKKTLQLVLREILVESNTEDPTLVKDLGYNVKMATVIITIIPIMLVYPFLQKHFTKGIMLGSVKG